ncbi:nucleotidyltransferase domain-containing protein [Devosia epidermidihirudinis]|nr:nucleotidyltransferase domain-containing protein [Devosia epidermidihirudinis]
MAHLAAAVSTITQRLIGLLDELLPGQLEAFYLVGSVAQGDYQAGQSDIDFVAVMSPPIELAALATAHTTLHQEFPGTDCDGIYLLPGELSRPPGGQGIAVRAGKVNPNSAEERSPVVWQVLAEDGIALRGRVADDSWVAVDRAATVDYSRANLQGYWRSWLEARRHLTSAEGETLLIDEAVVWGALGVARVHATIVNARVPSKTAAAAHALVVFPEYAEIISEALRLRTDPLGASAYQSPLARRHELIGFMDAVIRSDA